MFSAGKKPQFDTILKITRALGLVVGFRPAEAPRPPRRTAPARRRAAVKRAAAPATV
jgi:hypothetical protein